MRKCITTRAGRARGLQSRAGIRASVRLSADERLIIGRATAYQAPTAPWKWADEEVRFPESYPSPFKGRHDSAMVPFFRAPLEDLVDPEVRQVNLLKPSQAGATESVAQNMMRYHVARAPLPILFVGAQQEPTETLWNVRLKPGLKDCCRATAEACAKATESGMGFFFPDMFLQATWSTSLAGIKSLAYGLVIGDEVSTWPADTLEKLKKRVELYPFAKILLMSAMDKRKTRAEELTGKRRAEPAGDPMYVEYMASDRREWVMPDPKTGAPFRFEMGMERDGVAPSYGLKWDPAAKNEDGSWNLERVAATAHYVTPAGTVIQEAERCMVVNTGRWVATNPNAAPGNRGYRVTSWLLPWMSLGKIAVAFLEAQAKGRAYLRVFVLEWLVEEFWEKKDTAGEKELEARVGDYRKGQRPSQVEPYKTFYIGREVEVYTTVDMQKLCMKVVSREWIKGGDSGLIDWAQVDYNVVDAAHALDHWDKLDAIAEQHGAALVYIDSGYEGKQQEVYENCAVRQGMIPTKGADRRLTMDWVRTDINPFSGKRKQVEGQTIGLITFDTDVYKTKTLAMIRGEGPAKWRVYQKTERQYVNEVLAEEKIGAKWVEKKGHRHNDFWDCEVLQTLAATINGFMTESVETERRR